MGHIIKNKSSLFLIALSLFAVPFSYSTPSKAYSLGEGNDVQAYNSVATPSFAPLNSTFRNFLPVSQPGAVTPRTSLPTAGNSPFAASAIPTDAVVSALRGNPQGLQNAAQRIVMGQVGAAFNNLAGGTIVNGNGTFNTGGALNLAGSALGVNSGLLGNIVGIGALAANGTLKDAGTRVLATQLNNAFGSNFLDTNGKLIPKALGGVLANAITGANGGTNPLTGIKNSIAGAFSNLTGGNVFGNLTGSLSGLGGKLSDAFGNVTGGIKDMFSGLGDKLGGLFGGSGSGSGFDISKINGLDFDGIDFDSLGLDGLELADIDLESLFGNGFDVNAINGLDLDAIGELANIDIATMADYSALAGLASGAGGLGGAVSALTGGGAGGVVGALTGGLGGAVGGLLGGGGGRSSPPAVISPAGDGGAGKRWNTLHDLAD